MYSFIHPFIHPFKNLFVLDQLYSKLLIKDARTELENGPLINFSFICVGVAVQ